MTSSPEALVATLVRLHGEHAAPTAAQWERFLADDDGGPVQMVYLVQFREQADYPAHHDLTPRTGEEAFFVAGRVLSEVIREVGGQPLLGGFPTSQMVDAEPEDEDGGWDYVGAARYPSRDAFVRMWLDPRTVQAGVHRRAGTKRHRLVVTRPLY